MITRTGRKARKDRMDKVIFTFSACGRDFSSLEDARDHGRKEAIELGLSEFKIFEKAWLGEKLSSFITVSTERVSEPS